MNRRQASMFDIGDYIVYGNNGICKVLDITHPEIPGTDKSRLYYVLASTKIRDSKLYCPTDNDKIILRKVISADEAKAIIEETKTLEPMIIANNRERDDSYKNIIRSCDLRSCIQVLKALLLRKQQRENCGKKVTATDERFMKAVQDSIYNELAMAIGTEVETVKEAVLANCI
jgi:CarD family transcriptional regulator